MLWWNQAKQAIFLPENKGKLVLESSNKFLSSDLNTTLHIPIEKLKAGCIANYGSRLACVIETCDEAKKLINLESKQFVFP